MDRRWIFKMLAAAVVAVPFADRQAVAEGDKKTHKLAIHVDQNDVDVMKLALNNTRNANELYKAKGEELAVEIVCYSQGLHMLRDDTSPVKDRIKQLKDYAFPSTVQFSACNNTKEGMEKKEGHPITVLSSLPVALVGGLLTLWLFHAEASLYAYIGMFMLMGIVKKNGIMIVDFARQRVDAGEAAEKAIHDASMDRFRPILMTTLAAVFGALPIALGIGADGASRRPLGLVIVGGLVVSQFITLYITPVIYLYLEEFQENVLNRTAFFHSGHSELPSVEPSASPMEG